MNTKAINGKLTDLAATYAGHRLRADAAAAWLRLTAAFGREIRITDSYRPYSTQERIFTQRYSRQATGGGIYGDVRFWNGVRYVRKPGTAAAAVPGTSNHGWGLALDLADRVNTGSGPAWDWLQANAAHYGWHNPAWAKNPRTYEPWHWEYNPGLDQSKPAAGKHQSQIAKPEPEEEEDMPTLAEIQKAVWIDRTVNRNGERISAIQELADAKTLALENRAQIAVLAKAQGLDPTVLANAVKDALKSLEVKVVVD